MSTPTYSPELVAEAAERGISVPTLIRIKELVADWPPLTAETKARLAILLRPVPTTSTGRAA